MSNTAKRKLLHKENPYCYWCGVLTVERLPKKGITVLNDTSTLDHIYSTLNPNRPSDGGPVVISCYECNQIRGSIQRELGKFLNQELKINKSKTEQLNLVIKRICNSLGIKLITQTSYSDEFITELLKEVEESKIAIKVISRL